MEGAQGRRQGRDRQPTPPGRHQPSSSDHGRLLHPHTQLQRTQALQEFVQGYSPLPHTHTFSLSALLPPTPCPLSFSLLPSLPQSHPPSLPRSLIIGDMTHI